MAETRLIASGRRELILLVPNSVSAGLVLALAVGFGTIAAMHGASRALRDARGYYASKIEQQNEGSSLGALIAAGSAFSPAVFVEETPWLDASAGPQPEIGVVARQSAL
jgi:hypothetical protein